LGEKIRAVYRMAGTYAWADEPGTWGDRCPQKVVAREMIGIPTGEKEFKGWFEGFGERLWFQEGREWCGLWGC